jgi:REP element-mobilizing transposase RayT
MSRPLRLQYPGALYHVTSRGNARQAIYTDPADYTLWLSVLASVLERAHWRCYAYCLMSNHYHLLIETPEGNLSMGMRQLNGLYTQRFNRRHGRVGHVFQGRFKAIVVDRESYLLELCRYVVLNPVRAGVVKRPAQYRWSSYQATGGLAPVPGWLSRDWVLAQFSTRRARAEQLYRQFVEEGITTTASPWEQVRGQVVLGPEMFVEQLTPRLMSTAQATEIPQAQRWVARPALAMLFSAPQRMTRSRRNQTIWVAHMQHGYSLTAIGRHLGLHYSTISKIVQHEGQQQHS